MNAHIKIHIPGDRHPGSRHGVNLHQFSFGDDVAGPEEEVIAKGAGCEEIYTLINSTFNMCFTLYDDPPFARRDLRKGCRP